MTAPKMLARSATCCLGHRIQAPEKRACVRHSLTSKSNNSIGNVLLSLSTSKTHAEWRRAEAERVGVRGHETQRRGAGKLFGREDAENSGIRCRESCILQKSELVGFGTGLFFEK